MGAATTVAGIPRFHLEWLKTRNRTHHGLACEERPPGQYIKNSRFLAVVGPVQHKLVTHLREVALVDRERILRKVRGIGFRESMPCSRV